MRELSKCTKASAKTLECINIFREKTEISKLNTKLTGSFNGSDYSINEQNIPMSCTKKYIGVINGKNSEYIVNPENGKLHKGKIQGNIGNNNVNLIVSSDLFGRKTISGLYKKEQVELSISKNLSGIRIEGKDTDVVIRKTTLLLDKSLEGKFQYDRELMPLIISYIKHSDELRREAA